ncbi:MAG TPA: 30S ribosome-binding factor RbfA, partial [Hyphomicrobiales bacterium]|nr:30S ribosome-binding factor RbfA [Hyphomicrobiales bacterium]
MSRGRGRRGAKAPSQRQLRVGEVIRHALAEILSRGEVQDPDLKGLTVTVPEVRVSPDLKVATAYVMPLGGARQEEAVAALSRHVRFLRGEVAHKVSLTFMPELRFRLDTTFAESDRIEQLLRSPEVARDLRHDD